MIYKTNASSLVGRGGEPYDREEALAKGVESLSDYSMTHFAKCAMKPNRNQFCIT